MFDLEDKNGKEPSRVGPLVIRSFDTIYGRFQGAGIASVIACDDPKAGLRDRVDWLGDQNVYCGWKGFFASGADRTIRVPNLAAFRSTWNRGEESSLEILIPWLRPPLAGAGDARRPGSQPAGPGDHTQTGGRPPAVSRGQDALDISAANAFPRRYFLTSQASLRGGDKQRRFTTSRTRSHGNKRPHTSSSKPGSRSSRRAARFSTWFLTPTHRSGMAIWVSSCARSFPRG